MCAKYGVPVRDFSTSFADGRALCLLVHHYQPELLPLAKIHGGVPGAGATVGCLPGRCAAPEARETPFCSQHGWSASATRDTCIHL